MAAYAALVSLMHILNQLERHPSPPISLDKQQHQSLTQIVKTLQDFLDFGYSDEADPLEIRITGATYAVEDVIESYIVDNIHLSAAAANDHTDDEPTAVEEISCIIFYEDLQKVIQEMDSIKKQVMEMVRVKKVPADAVAVAGFRSIPIERKNVMVGFDGELLQLLDRLTGGHSNRQIIPIVGMGGIGKTTLARNVFHNTLIKEYFDVCVWATISHDYNIQETLNEVLSQLGRGCLGAKSEDEMGLELHKYLWGRRYLVIMDDMWTIEVWDKMKIFFPDCSDGSRIVVTTRISELGGHLSDSNSLDMRFLDPDSSWKLFSKTVFGEDIDRFPVELEKIGEKIVKNCSGLPLAIVVVGGLLAGPRRHTQEYWEHIEENLNSIVNTENDEYCLRVLKMSYNHLPAYLKPCFLYMGVFEEDREIRVSTIFKLWVSEGFLKPITNKSLETIAKEYLKELVDRNLIMVHKLGARGNIKYCKVHDLLRDICLKESEEQSFYHVCGQHSPPTPSIDNDRRQQQQQQHNIVIPNSTSHQQVLDAMESIPHARSYICHECAVDNLPNSRLLRTLKTSDPNSVKGYREYCLEDVLRFVNLRYCGICVVPNNNKFQVSSSIHLLWNLHTLSIYCWDELYAPIEIWKMHQLRCAEFRSRGVYLPDPDPMDDEIIVMENLETLKGVINLNLSQEVVRRVPNLKKLKVKYTERPSDDRVSCLSFLERLSKLEIFCCSTGYGCDEYLHRISFPLSLKKLNLFASYDYRLQLEDILHKIGSLPLVEKLVLEGGFFKTNKMETVDGQFPKLKVLKLRRCRYLRSWTVSESFPFLQELRLYGLTCLKEIPPEIGDIPTLKSIVLNYCSDSAVLSAKRIVEEQEDLYGEQLDLHARVKLLKSQKELHNLATHNFEVELTTIDLIG